MEYSGVSAAFCDLTESIVKGFNRYAVAPHALITQRLGNSGEGDRSKVDLNSTRLNVGNSGKAGNDHSKSKAALWAPILLSGIRTKYSA